jgi:hypothetical protein
MAISIGRTGLWCALVLTVIGCGGLRSAGERAAIDSGLTSDDGGVSGAGGNAGVSGQAGNDAGMSGSGSGAGGHSGMPPTGDGDGDGDGDDELDAGRDAGPNDSGTDSGGDDEPDADVDSSVDSGGDGDADTEPTTAIAGRVIDYYENPVANVPVTLNGVTVMTDATGDFEFDSAPPTYSISLSITFPVNGLPQQAGYLFVDLTRRDPTLQVVRGNSVRSGNVTRTAAGVSFSVSDDEYVFWDVAGQYGETEGEFTGPTQTSSVQWEGPVEAVAHAHAIRLVTTASSPIVPMTYLAHDGESFALNDDVTTSYTLDLSSSEPLPAAIVSGDITAPSGGTRENHVYVRFPDDAAVKIITSGAPGGSYSFLVPQIATSSIAIAATHDSGFGPPYAVAYVDGVAPGATDVDLEIPVPATPIAPASAATNVDENTTFTWSGDDQVYMFVAREASIYYETFYVITAAKQAQLPISHVTVPALRRNQTYLWNVRTHRRFATVDDATGPDGYLDSYCYGRLRGPRRGAGTHTASANYSFTTAP